ncbi:MOSC domain-containing protein [Agromyces archimandritae]|uniref:MOSC domain-containing protein n=1 Tax=Agromyces archimandritae TaxID=2781962 RepID=A0A975FKK8_9MICO|nr:MOSC N-terminal beta barrel domain-containing protein [Agromyces archimandritae]QTX03642.1 MOSC domain-containing protein [Agromyces archimandritae]
MRVTRLFVYPVKAFAGVPVDRAEVLPWGLAGDRRWGVIDADARPVRADRVNGLIGLGARLTDDGLVLSDRDGAELAVRTPVDASPMPVGHSRQGTALPAGSEADAWLTARFDRPLRLVWQPDPRARSIDPDDGGLPGDTLTFADAAPLLLTSEASLAQLDEWTPGDVEPLDMRRFRPNVVIDGEEPFAEEGWSHVRLGGLRYRVTMVCDRCVVTTIDPDTLERGKDPIRVLAQHRRRDGKTWFGIRLVPELPVGTAGLAGGADASGADAAPHPAPSAELAVGDPVSAEAGGHAAA